MKITTELLGKIDSRDLDGISKLLAQYPYLFNFELFFGWPIIHLCFVKRCVSLETIKSYIAAGGDVNRRTSSGVSLLFLARGMPDGQLLSELLHSAGAQMSKFELCVLTLENELNDGIAQQQISRFVKEEPTLLCRVGDKGFTLLHHALSNFRYEIAIFLVKAGADSRVVTSEGRSCLGFFGLSVDEEGVSCFNLLRARGAQFTLREEILTAISDGKDSEVIALVQKQPELTHAWIPSRGPILHVAAWVGKNVGLLEGLLAMGADPNVPNELGETTLHRVMQRAVEEVSKSLSMIRLLVKYGAEIDKPDDKGYTPLHAAADRLLEEPIKLLVELGANLNARSIAGETPLDIVKNRRFLGYRAVSNWMIMNGARSGKG
jgi:ankyrin repeat protein